MHDTRSMETFRTYEGLVMETITSVEILKKARSLLKQGWCRKAIAKTKWGRGVLPDPVDQALTPSNSGPFGGAEDLPCTIWGDRAKFDPAAAAKLVNRLRKQSEAETPRDY